MAGIAGAGINQLVDVADTTTKQALVAVGSLEEAAVTAASGALTVGDVSFKTAMAEVEKTRASFIEALRQVALTVTAPIDAIV